MPTVITTSTASSATALFNQRKVDRTQNGNLWVIYWDGTSGTSTPMQTRYSTDNGATWTDPGTGSAFGFAGTGTTYTPTASFFIDLDDYAHVVYKDRHAGDIRYRRGTPNAGRTTWTWSAATVVSSVVTAIDYPDVVAHREGSDWRAHVVFSRHDSTTNDSVYYARVDITSGGTVSIGVAAAKISEASYGNTGAKVPSIDFNHSGDGKTVGGSTPHLYAAWTANSRGAGKGIRFKKAAYSGGTWTWGTEREIDNSRDPGGTGGWLNCLFDGTRVVIAGFLIDSAGTAQDLMIYDRDAADTATTTRNPLADAPTSTRLLHGSAAYDSSGNVYVFGANQDEGAGSKDLVWRKWARGSDTLSAETVIDASVDVPYLSVKRGYSFSRIEFIYTDGTASPFSVTYDGISLNTAPNAPSLLTPIGAAVIDRAVTQRFDWDFSDPDAGDTQSKYDLRYKLTSSGTWTDITNTTANTYHDFSPSTFAAGDYEWQARTYDAAGLVGPYSSSAFFTAADAPATPTITAPTSGGTIGTNPFTVTWSAPNQAEYQVRTVADNAGSPDTSTIYTDTGTVVSASSRSRSVAFDTNNRWEHVQVRVKYNGLWSAYASHRANVSYTPPAAPTVTFTVENATGSLLVNITNPAPGGGQPTVTHNEVEVDDGNGWERRAASVTPSTAWRYWLPKSDRSYTGKVRVTAVGDNGTRTTTTA